MGGYDGSLREIQEVYAMSLLVRLQTEERLQLFAELKVQGSYYSSSLRFGGSEVKNKAIGYDYGEYEICDTPMQEKRIKQDFWIRGELIVVENVPAGVCPCCGEKVIRADVGQWITELIENSERIAKAPRISVPAIRFDLEETKV
jgi:YgiT-type zinc finger domain-containing protein